MALPLLVLGSLLVLAGGGTPADRPFELKSGEVVLSNSVMKDTTITIYFDDYGKRVATYAMEGSKVMGVTLKTDQGLIAYDPVRKTGTRHAGPPPGPGSGGFPPLSPTQLKAMSDAQAMSEGMKKDLQVEPLPAKTIAGREATGYLMQMGDLSSRIWTWKGIPLYTETTLGGGKGPVTVISATSIQEGPVPAEKFTVPADVKLEDH